MSASDVPWWRLDGLPTADEWQAIAAVLTLIVATAAAIVAIVQIRQGARQLRLSAEANERAAEAAEAEARPYISVYFDLRVLANGDPKSPNGEGLVFVVVESLGRTPAREISLAVEPMFRTSGRGRPGAAEDDPAMLAFAHIFSGDPNIGMLAPGQKLEYLLDFTAEAVGPDTGLPQRYEVTARYTDATARHRYEEPHILDLKPWSYSIAMASAMDVIARQLRRVNENLEQRS